MDPLGVVPPGMSEPWWVAETALDATGGLAVPLTERWWWEDVESLAVGEERVIRSRHAEDEEGLMVLRREVGRPLPYEHVDPADVWQHHLLQEGSEMLVWVIDDGNELDPENPRTIDPADPHPAASSAVTEQCYVVDYGVTGTVDRMLDFVDEDGDGSPELMDIRYFSDGELRHSIVHQDIDGDGRMYAVHDYQRLVGPSLAFLIDANGDNMYYHNKYDPERRAWTAISECPFAFHDLTGTGGTDRVIRFSVAPLEADLDRDSDYANSWRRLMGPFEPAACDTGAVAVRDAYCLDGGADETQPIHYEAGLQMIGALPYDTDAFAETHERRRPPRTSATIPHDRTPTAADGFTAEATGFSWREFADGTQSIGDFRRDPDDDRRWEGIFWTWRRRPLHNTGAPNQYWNVRREYHPAASTTRELYASPMDDRLHLKGAHEGWLPVGAIGDESPIGEIRTYDTTGDGYFNRWEYWWAGAARPYRVVSVPNADNRDIGALGQEWEGIRAFYTESLLPEAIERNRSLIAVLETIDGASAPDRFTEALSDDLAGGERLYLLGLIRECLYDGVRQLVAKTVDRHLDRDTRWGPLGDPDARDRDQLAWAACTQAGRCDAAYERADYEAVERLLAELAETMAAIESRARS